MTQVEVEYKNCQKSKSFLFLLGFVFMCVMGVMFVCSVCLCLCLSIRTTLIFLECAEEFSFVCQKKDVVLQCI